MSYNNTLISGEFSIVAMALLEALQAFLNQLMGHLTATSAPCGRDITWSQAPWVSVQERHQLSSLGRSFHSPFLNILTYKMGRTIVPIPQDCLNQYKVTKTVPGI